MVNLNWKLDAKLGAHKYHGQVERDAFRGGYSDGFYGYPQRPGDWPNAYGAGYWEGHGDRAESEVPA